MEKEWAIPLHESKVATKDLLRLIFEVLQSNGAWMGDGEFSDYLFTKPSLAKFAEEAVQSYL